MIINRAPIFVLAFAFLNLPSVNALSSDFRFLQSDHYEQKSFDNSIKIPGFGVACQDPTGAAVHIYPLDETPGNTWASQQDQRQYGRVAITLTSEQRLTVSSDVHFAKHTVSADGDEMYVFSEWLNPLETARLVLPQPGDLFKAYFVFDFDAGERYLMPQHLNVCRLN